MSNLSLSDYLSESVRAGQRTVLNEAFLLKVLEKNDYTDVSSDINPRGSMTIPMDLIRQFNGIKSYAEFVDEDTGEISMYITTGISPTVSVLTFTDGGDLIKAIRLEVSPGSRTHSASERKIYEETGEVVDYLRKRLKGL